VGAGNANQAGQGNGNISNDQFRLFTGLTQPQQPVGNAVQANGQTVTTQQTAANQPTALSQPPTAGTQPENQPALTNADVSSTGQQGNGNGAGKNGNGVLLFQNGQGGGAGGGLSPLGQKVADAVKGTSDAVKGALTSNKPATGSTSSNGSAGGGS
jgi:hypothetical protein